MLVRRGDRESCAAWPEIVVRAFRRRRFPIWSSARERRRSGRDGRIAARHSVVDVPQVARTGDRRRASPSARVGNAANADGDRRGAGQGFQRGRRPRRPARLSCRATGRARASARPAGLTRPHWVPSVAKANAKRPWSRLRHCQSADRNRRPVHGGRPLRSGVDPVQGRELELAGGEGVDSVALGRARNFGVGT